MTRTLTRTAVGMMLAAGATAQAGTTQLQIIDDFDAATVFRPFFPGFDDRAAITDQARFQVNGDETGSTGTLGIFTVFDIDGSSIRPSGGAQSIEDITVNLFPRGQQRHRLRRHHQRRRPEHLLHHHRC